MLNIRPAIRKLLGIAKNEDGAIQSDNKLAFASFNEKKGIFEAIYKDLLKKRGAVKNSNAPVFYGDSKGFLKGYLSDIYGYTGLLSLSSEVTLDDKEIENLIQNINYILDEIDQYGFTLYPYVAEADNKVKFNNEEVLLFDGGDYPFMGALTWTISFLSSVKKAIIHKETIFDNEEKEADVGFLQIDQSDFLVKRINDMILDIVIKFNRSIVQGEDGTLLGWNYTGNCEEASLFFTYSVLEAFSDFEDNILDTVVDEETGVITRTFKPAFKDLEDTFNSNKGKQSKSQLDVWADYCEQVALHVWDVYKKELGHHYVDDHFLEGFNVIKLEDIEKMDHSNALFNNVYLVCILLYGWTNKKNIEESDAIIAAMENALQNVQRDYDDFKRRNIDYLISSYSMQFTSKHNERDYLYVKNLNYRRISDTTLLPILIKANNLIAFYITQYPVKKMDDLFQYLFDEDNICDDAVLWDDKGYDVKITERYIEAINQFYEYYDKYEKEYNKGFIKAKTDAYREGWNKSRDKQIEKNKSALEQAKLDKENAIKEERAKFVIENAIVDRIQSGVISSIIEILKETIIEWYPSWPGLQEGKEENVSNLLKELVKAYAYQLLNSKVYSDSFDFDNILKDFDHKLGGLVDDLASEKKITFKALIEDKKGDNN